MIGYAISGKAGAGKSTLARHLTRSLFAAGYPSRIDSFGTALKAEVWELYGLAKQDEGGREKLIEHGEARRAADPAYWIKELNKTVLAARAHGLLLVVDDLRFPLEYGYLAGSGFQMVRLEATPLLRAARLAEQGLDPEFALSDSVTECSLDHGYRWDWIVENDGQDLRVVADGIVAGTGLTPQKRGEAEASPTRKKPAWSEAVFSVT